jgi:hypothetical protein
VWANACHPLGRRLASVGNTTLLCATRTYTRCKVASKSTDY